VLYISSERTACSAVHISSKRQLALLYIYRTANNVHTAIQNSEYCCTYQQYRTANIAVHISNTEQRTGLYISAIKVSK
jgi:hypothetical protein